MAFNATVKRRVDSSVGKIHSQAGVTVYVRRLVPSQPDDVYEEDTTKVEKEFRLKAIVDRNPLVRQMERFGQTEPVDLMVTFSKWHLDRAFNTGTNLVEPLDAVVNDDVIVLRGIRYKVVKDREAPQAPMKGVLEQNAEPVQWSVLATITKEAVTDKPEPGDPDYVPPDAVTRPILQSITATSSPTNAVLALHFQVPVEVHGTASNRMLIAIGDEAVDVVSVVIDGADDHKVNVTLAVPLTSTGRGVFTYQSSDTATVVDGITSVGAATPADEMEETFNIPFRL